MNDQQKAIVAHLTVIGWVITLVFHLRGPREPLTTFYLRQYLGIMLSGLAISLIARFAPILSVLSLLVFAAWVYSLVGAVRRERWVLPAVGDSFQNAFRGL